MSVWGFLLPLLARVRHLHELVPAFYRTFPLMGFVSFQLGTIKPEKNPNTLKLSVSCLRLEATVWKSAKRPVPHGSAREQQPSRELPGDSHRRQLVPTFLFTRQSTFL